MLQHKNPLNIENMTRRFIRVFEPKQADVLAEVIYDAYTDLVKTSDFNELKAIVQGLAEAQQRTEVKVAELAEAQQRTEVKVAELAEAQQRTEAKVAELAELQRETRQDLNDLTKITAQLAQGLSATRSELAGLNRSFGYALENEAYRMLPAFLADRHGIQVEKRFARTYLGDREINLIASGMQKGEAVVIVGEAKAQLGTDDFQQLEASVAAAQAAQQAGDLPPGRIIPLMITHMARPAVRREAEKRNIIIVQSFEW